MKRIDEFKVEIIADDDELLHLKKKDFGVGIGMGTSAPGDCRLQKTDGDGRQNIHPGILLSSTTLSLR